MPHAESDQHVQFGAPFVEDLRLKRGVAAGFVAAGADFQAVGDAELGLVDRAAPAWYPKLRGKPKPVTIYMRLILPAEAADAAVAPEAEAN